MTAFDADFAAADDLLQAMYWLRGEGLAPAVDEPTLARWSGLDPVRLRRALDTLLRRGLVERARAHGERYRLTDDGVREGAAGSPTSSPI